VSEAGRLLALEGSVNFRDLGGLRTGDGRALRHGRVFRSDALHRLSDADLERLRGPLGVRTQIDLRASHEVASEGRGRLAEPPVAYHHLPFFDTPRAPSDRVFGSLDEIYFAMLRYARAPIARAVEALAASPGAAVFHCAAGKDRTGVLAAVVLGAVGVTDEEIVEDYAYTRRALPRILERLRESEAYQHVFSELPPDTLHAEPKTMEALLARAKREWGSLRGYARFAGASEAALDALAARLLDDAPLSPPPGYRS
jgi:protein tyrosine/serine phosphatase